MHRLEIEVPPEEEWRFDYDENPERIASVVQHLVDRFATVRNVSG